MQPDPTKTSDARQATVPRGEPDEPKDSRRNQRERILRMLMDANGGWVSSQDLVAMSCQYSSRVFELRHRPPHWDIENKVTVENGKKHGHFRIRRFVSVENGKLVSKPATTTPRDSDRDDDTPLLFPREAMESCLGQRHRDEG